MQDASLNVDTRFDAPDPAKRKQPVKKEGKLEARDLDEMIANFDMGDDVGDISVICAFCGFTNEDGMIACDKCDLAWHMGCIGVRAPRILLSFTAATVCAWAFAPSRGSGT